nr:MAG TPA: Transcriptional regulator, RHH-like, CopG [Caudoviricetes sp.]
MGKWITVEVPEEVHTKVRIKTFQENKTVKNYVLQLILKDLHTKKE